MKIRNIFLKPLRFLFHLFIGAPLGGTVYNDESIFAYERCKRGLIACFFEHQIEGTRFLLIEDGDGNQFFAARELIVSIYGEDAVTKHENS